METRKRQFVTQELSLRQFHSAETVAVPVVRDKMSERCAWIRHYLHQGLGPVYIRRTVHYVTDFYRLKSIYKLNDATYSYVYYDYDGVEKSGMMVKFEDVIIPMGEE